MESNNSRVDMDDTSQNSNFSNNEMEEDGEEAASSIPPPALIGINNPVFPPFENVCDFCGKNYCSKRDLKRHRDTVHLKLSRHKCDKCEMWFSNVTDMKRHFQSTYHLGLRPYKCRKCSRYFKEKERFDRHQIEMPNCDELKRNPPNQVKCEFCNQTYSDKYILKRHVLNLHLKDRNFKCPQCSRVFRSKSGLTMHVRACLLEKKESTKRPSKKPTNRKYKCPGCSTDFTVLGSYTDHKKLCPMYADWSIHRERVKCDLCNAMLSDAKGLAKHKRFVHDRDLPYHCDKCNLQFRLERDLNRHLESATPNGKEFKNAKCHGCKRYYPDKGALERHQARDPNCADTYVRPRWECDLCPKDFHSKRALKIHKDSLHFRSTTCSCHMCGKLFLRKDSLRGHMRSIHNTELDDSTLDLDKIPAPGEEIREPGQKKKKKKKKRKKEFKEEAEDFYDADYYPEDYENYGYDYEGVRVKSEPEHQEKEEDDFIFDAAQAIDQFFKAEPAEQDQGGSPGDPLDLGAVEDDDEPFFSEKEDESNDCEFCHQSFGDSQELADHILLNHKSIMSMEMKEPKVEHSSDDISDTDGALQDGDEDFVPSGDCKPKKKRIKKPVKLEEAEVDNDNANPGSSVTQSQSNESDLTRHVCEQCGKTYKEKRSLERHVLVVHTKDNPFRCEKCDIGFRDQIDLDRHCRTPKHLGTGVRTIRCPKCHKYYKDQDQLERHFISKPNCENDYNPDAYKCEECGKKFHAGGALRRHINIAHKGLRHNCPGCNVSFRSRFSLTTHYLKNEECKAKAGWDPVRKKTAKPQSYICDQCGRNFNSNSDLKKHVNFDHLDICIFKCEKCNVKCRDKTHFAKHMKSLRHRGLLKTHKCPDCARVFRDQLKLDKHRSDMPNCALVPIESYPCQQCDQMFQTRQGLIRHEDRVHLRIHPFSCHKCEKTFPRKDYLVVHLESPLGCRIKPEVNNDQPQHCEVPPIADSSETKELTSL